MLIAGAAFVMLGGGCVATPSEPMSSANVTYKDLVVLNLFDVNTGSGDGLVPIANPLVLKGKARGVWYFEASFPVKVLNSADQEIGVGIAQAQSDWMTEDYVPFVATVNYPPQTSGSLGSLVIIKDNPSGLPENEDSFTVPITF